MAEKDWYAIGSSNLYTCFNNLSGLVKRQWEYVTELNKCNSAQNMKTIVEDKKIYWVLRNIDSIKDKLALMWHNGKVGSPINFWQGTIKRSQSRQGNIELCLITVFSGHNPDELKRKKGKTERKSNILHFISFLKQKLSSWMLKAKCPQLQPSKMHTSYYLLSNNEDRCCPQNH